MFVDSKSALSFTMNFDDLERPAWGVISPQEGDMGLVKETIRKEQAIK